MIGKSAKGDRGGVGVTGDVHGNVNIGIDAEIALEAKDKLIANLEKQLNERTEMLTELRKADAGKHQAEITLLQQQITELQRRLTHPEQALRKTQDTITKLDDVLNREGNDIGESRMAEARNALKAGDFSIADGIFAEIEAHELLAVERSAHAAFARGEIAEQEIRWNDAAKHFARAAALHPTYENLHIAWDYAEKSGNYDDALILGLKLVNTAKTEFGENHWKYAVALNSYATTLQSKHKFKDAEQAFLEAIKIGEQELGEFHSDFIRLNNNLGLLYSDRKKYDLALPYLLHAVKAYEHVIGKTDPAYSTCLNNLALLYKRSEQYELAEPIYKKVIEIDKKILGDHHPYYARGIYNLAKLYSGTGKYDLAEPLYKQSIRILDATLGVDHPRTNDIKADYQDFLKARPKPSKW